MNPEPPEQLKAVFAAACAKATDIHEHLPVMAEYAARCAHVTEFGVGTGQSTRAWLYAQPQKLVCYDSAPPCEAVVELLLPLRGRTEVVFHLADSRRISIEPTDLLFIDSTHSFNHLLVELLLHAPQTRKYILLHDTTIFGHRGDDNISPGIWYAIEDFLLRFPEWKLVERRMNCNGLTILERVPLTPSM